MPRMLRRRLRPLPRRAGGAGLTDRAPPRRARRPDPVRRATAVGGAVERATEATAGPSRDGRTLSCSLRTATNVERPAIRWTGPAAACYLGSMSLTTRFSFTRELVSLGPEELGAVLLAQIHELVAREEGYARTRGMRAYAEDWPVGFNLDSLLALIQNLPPDAPGWPRTEWPKVKLAAMEAWGWLTTAGLIMPHPASPASCVLTRRGRNLRTEADVSRYRDDGVLPAGLLHPRIAGEVRVLFTRGHFSTAVFYAFRELEVARRQAVQGEPQWTGQQVVRAAFNPTHVWETEEHGPRAP